MNLKKLHELNDVLQAALRSENLEEIGYALNKMQYERTMMFLKERERIHNERMRISYDKLGWTMTPDSACHQS